MASKQPTKIASLPHGEYIYLIQERESIRCNDNVYKIGKTKQKPHRRMEGYPKDSMLFLTIIVDNCDVAELDLIHMFAEKFEHDIRIGNEYFVGDPIEMMKCILDYQSEHFTLNSINEKIKALESKADVLENEEKNIMASAIADKQAAKSKSKRNVKNKTVKLTDVLDSSEEEYNE